MNLRIRTAAEARGLTVDELIHRLETGRLSRSAVLPTLADQLAFEAWLADRAAAQRAAREMVSLVCEIERERRARRRPPTARGLRVRVENALRNAGITAASFCRPPRGDALAPGARVL